MAIKVGGTEVVDNNRQLKNIASVDSATVTALGAAGVGGGSSFDATMSGSVADGKPMILKTDGTLEAVGESAVALDPPQDSHHVEVVTSQAHAVAYHPVHKRSVMVFRDLNDSNKVKFGILNTGDGTSALTASGFGTTIGSYDCYEVDIAYDPITENFVAVWRGTNNQGYCVTLSIASSGSTITFGSVQNFTGTSITEPKVACGNTSGNSFGNAVIIWKNQASPNRGHVILFNLEPPNRNMVQRTTGYFNNGATLEIDIGYDPDTDRFLIVYRDNSNSDYGTCKVVEVANNTGVDNSTLTLGSAVVYDSNRSDDNTLAYDTTANKMVIVWEKNNAVGSGDRIYARVGTITGGSTNSISFGTAVEVSSSNSFTGTSVLKTIHDPDANKLIVLYRLASPNEYARAKTGTVSGTSISFSSNEDSNISLSTNMTRLGVSIAYDTNIKATIYSFTKSSDNSVFAGKIKTQNIVTNLTSSNYIGIADAAYTNGQTATVQTLGAIDDAQSSLTIGSKYYVQPNGTIGTSAGSPSVEAGLAVSATNLLVKG